MAVVALATAMLFFITASATQTTGAYGRDERQPRTGGGPPRASP